MIEVPVYLPHPDAPATASARIFATANLAPHSAIVGMPHVRPGPDTLVIVYYEGNLYHAVNMVTFADRAMIAYYRMRDRYPTVATAALPLGELLHAGNLYPEHGRVEPLDGRGLYQLAEWLGIPLEDDDRNPALRYTTTRLASELRCSGVTVRA